MVLAIAAIVVPNGPLILAVLAPTTLHRVPGSVLDEVVVIPS